jgi:hypothetical protein
MSNASSNNQTRVTLGEPWGGATELPNHITHNDLLLRPAGQP